MVILRLGDGRDPVDEVDGLDEVLDLERLDELLVVVDQPALELRPERLDLCVGQRRCAAPAGNALVIGERRCRHGWVLHPSLLPCRSPAAPPSPAGLRARRPKFPPPPPPALGGSP